MFAIKQSSKILLSLSLAVVCLLGVFAIIGASRANASESEILQPGKPLDPSVIITPTELQATIYPNNLLTQTLWITNTCYCNITYTVYEISAPVRMVSSIIQPAMDPVVDPLVQEQVTAQGKAQVIILLRELPDVSAAYSIPDKVARRRYVYAQLLETASHSQELFDWLEKQSARPRRLLTANAIAATLDAAQLSQVAGNPLVKGILPVEQRLIMPSVPAPLLLPEPLESGPAGVEWNIAKIRADLAWSTYGITGQGAVVGSIDTGVEYDHPALVNSYRGNLGGGNFDHNYSWFDFVNGQPVAYDDVGHGTEGIGFVSGDDGGENQIGVAPGAQWIAVKALDAGGATTDEILHASFEWMLAPTDLSGQNPDPSKAPDVVLNGWGAQGCSSEFENDLAFLRAAGILPVFSPGGEGPGCGTIGSPADLPDALAAGATDQNDLVASFSSRGPSCYGEIKPDLSAPGVEVRTSTLGGGYATLSGTSWSAAHVAGAAAMLVSADAMLGPDAIEDLLYGTTLCLENLSCGGNACPEGANNVYGHGRIDVFEAVSAALDYPAFDLPWLTETPISGTIGSGEGVAVQVIYNSNGLGEGTYMGGLGITTSDPQYPYFSVPVTLEVIHPAVPQIVVEPQAFSATLTVGGMQTDTLTISNVGETALTLSLYEVTGTKRQEAMPVAAPTLAHPQDLPAPAARPVVDASIRLQQLFLGRTRLILYLNGQPDFSAASRIAGQAARARYVYNQLLQAAAGSADLYDWLVAQGAQPRRLLTANAIAATLDASQLQAALSFPQVRQVTANRRGTILQDGSILPSWLELAGFTPGLVEWNIAKIRADQVWSTFGIRGQGAVVGVIDTGVMYTHPALNTQYRGTLGDGNYDHNYNWFDFVNGQTVPYDDNGHGTFGAGIAEGDDGAGNQIGVAPSAKWIAVKALSGGGGATEEDLHAALQWMLAPTDLNGANPDPALAPNVVLNMWGWFACDDHTFDLDLDALRAANILPVFAPGGEGPGCGTVISPAANPDALSAGATDIDDMIGSFSAHGPSCYDGSIKPDVVAPGVDIRSSTADGDYATWSGTSFSTAHLAGASALLFSADPQISLLELEQTLFDTAVCHDDQLYCGGEACPGANNIYGYGRIDVFEAVSALMGSGYDIPWLIAGPLTAEIQPGSSITTPVTIDAAGLAPGTYLGGIAIDSNDPATPHLVLPVELTVLPACEPVAGLTASFTPLNPFAGEEITFTASTSGTLPITYTWTIEDGSVLVGPQVVHTFQDPGTYSVDLIAMNACGEEEWQLTVDVAAVLQRFLLPFVQR